MREENRRKHISEIERKRIAWSQDWRCNHCQELLPYTYEIDHVKALSLGGEDDVNNMQALCNNCHAQKTIGDNRRARALRRFQRVGVSEPIFCSACNVYYSLYFMHQHFNCR